MASVTIAPFKATPVASISSTAARTRKTFVSQRTKSYDYRVSQLRRLYWAITDNTPAIIEACRLDLNKSVFEAYSSEIDWCKNDILFILKNLETWMQDESAPDIPLPFKFMSPKIRKDPLGAVLIIGCWNFPIQLSLGPLIGAIAAGCTAVLKPSEVSSNTAMVVKKIMDEALDSDAYACVNGGVEETTAALNEKWAKIFYTGNSQVGTIIAKKAAETLTPVCLELGGLNPAIITRHADPRLAARRLLWGKILNAGQVCISHNYTMVEGEILDRFVVEMKKALKEFFPKGAKASPDFARIVNDRHYNRIKKMLDGTKGKILAGGETDDATKFIEPTLILVDSDADSTLIDESFGPLMPVLVVSNVDEAISIAQSIHDTPLGLYPFGNKAETEKILANVISGGASINDSYFHGSIGTMPFGGVGQSGQGAYRGKASFETFVHRRSITTTPAWIESMLSVRYPPYEGKLKQLQAQGNGKPNFDRSGKTIYGITYWIGFVLALGGKNARNGLFRWILLALVAVTSSWYTGYQRGLPSYLR